MLSIKQALQIKPVFILAVDYNAGSIGEMVGENRDLNKYLAEMTIQHHSLLDGACLSFTIECLISVIDDLVVIEEMDTSRENHSVYANNVDGLQDINGLHTFIYFDDIDEALQDCLIDLIENQPIYDIPNHFIIEAY